jgi:putative aldouronate transport system substrate-binding protein
MINDAVVKYVMGEINRAGFEAVIKQWLNVGGQKLIDEFSAQYKG